MSRSFFARPARVVAAELLGTRLVHNVNGQRVGGIIVETEAYCDSAEPDLACHGTRNKGKPTKRTQVMFGDAGFVYIYLNYGIHWMFNIVTGEPGQANAVLVRALEPVEGLAFIAERRMKQPPEQWTNGPGKLTKALAIDMQHHAIDLTEATSVLWIESGTVPAKICTGPRVGLGKTPEPWFSVPWRFWVDGSRYVSKYR